MIKILWAIKCFFGLGFVKDGSICWFSQHFYDIHDYYVNKGGDGIPSHFYEYTCSNCGKKFSI